MFSLINAARKRLCVYSTVLARPLQPTASVVQMLTRGYKTNKTHQGAAKRWRKMSNGDFKRKQCGRLHGNVGWSKARVLNHLNGTVRAKGKGHGNQKKKLHRMLPHA